MAHKFSTSYIEDSLSLFRFYKKSTEGAMEQVSDEQLFQTLDEEMNSIAIIVKHMAGNMRSRWTNFLTTDGEKPDRHRDRSRDHGGVPDHRRAAHAALPNGGRRADPRAARVTTAGLASILPLAVAIPIGGAVAAPGRRDRGSDTHRAPLRSAGAGAESSRWAHPEMSANGRRGAGCRSITRCLV